MKKKLSLELDGLSVESFTTDAVAGDGIGTVRGAENDKEAAARAACTCFASCLCPTAYYWCGDGYHTIYSCDYSANVSCLTGD